MSVYLYLFHGRRDTNKDMEHWGDEGPVLGPFDWVHTTYGWEVKAGHDGDADAEFSLIDGMVLYGGVYYGDWSVFDGETMERVVKNQGVRIEALDPAKVNR